MARPIISPYSYADLRSPKSVEENQKALLNALVLNGHTGAVSWAPLTQQSALVEIEADALCDLQHSTKEIVESKLNSVATGDALKEHSLQVYDNTPLAGQMAIVRLQLTDTGAGPYTFSPESVSFSVGVGGLEFDGIRDPNSGATQVTLPLNGSVYVFAQAKDIGADWNVAAGRINTISRGNMPGVIVTNPADGYSVLGSQQGAPNESEASLRTRNSTKWETLSVGSSQGAYENRVRDASVDITRVECFTNLDMNDPGTITVMIAGVIGALPPQIVLLAQNSVSPSQIGGPNQPETARVIVASASNNRVIVKGTFYVPGTTNTPAFQQQVLANIVTFFSRLRIGQKVSYERVIQVAFDIAGLDPDTIEDGGDFTLNNAAADVLQLYYEVAVPDLTGLKFVPV